MSHIFQKCPSTVFFLCCCSEAPIKFLKRRSAISGDVSYFRHGYIYIHIFGMAKVISGEITEIAQIDWKYEKWVWCIKSFLKAQFVSTIHKGTSQDKCDVASDTTKNYQFKSFVIGYFAIFSEILQIFCDTLRSLKDKTSLLLIFLINPSHPRMFELFLLIFRQFLLSRIFVFSRFKLYRITNPSQFISSASYFLRPIWRGFSDT